jgi:hypothetical protein
VPPWLIDSERGAVLLRLVPWHTERLHGPAPPDPIWVYDNNGERQPRPLLRSGDHVDAVLTADSTLGSIESIPVTGEARETHDGGYWFDWDAYVRLPFGWAWWGTALHLVKLPGRPEQEAPIRTVRLHLVDRDFRDSFDRIDAWLREALGDPSATGGDRRLFGWTARWRRWYFAWGAVFLSYEFRDNSPELDIMWERPTQR